ncbi:TetR/AcrR family transcriptional regulator [Brevibacterium aurantiacum]|uniref:TetR/AcrR family transcriptional regulator n=1 Tax=Brevibacterium aurantiacum TaxID=273384 RepID=UPI0013DE118C|nr:TetR/AcrR family transcriptional regulator [Brevibacterium aurantiacum]
MSASAFARMPRAKRQALIFAAAEEFASRPFEQASLNSIISAASMSKSSFYHVIDSKESLLSLVVDELRELARREWTPPDPSSFASDFWKTAAHVFDDALRVWPQVRALELLWRIVHENRADPGVTSLESSYQKWISSVLEIGREAGAIDAECPADLQAVAAASMLGAFDEWTLQQTSRDSRTGDSIEAAAGQQFRLLKRLLEA